MTDDRQQAWDAVRVGLTVANDDGTVASGRFVLVAVDWRTKGVWVTFHASIPDAKAAAVAGGNPHRPDYLVDLDTGRIYDAVMSADWSWEFQPFASLVLAGAHSDTWDLAEAFDALRAAVSGVADSRILSRRAKRELRAALADANLALLRIRAKELW